MFNPSDPKPEVDTPSADEPPPGGETPGITGKFLSTLRPSGSAASSRTGDTPGDRPEPAVPGPGGAAEAPAPAPEAGHEGRIVIGEGVEVVGQIRACRRIEIFGTVDGDLEVEDVVVHGGGLLKGKVKAQRVEVHGAIDGEVSVRDLLHVKPGGSVAGRTEYGALSIETGGRVVGTLDDGPARKQGPSGTEAVAPAPAPDFVEPEGAGS